MSTNEIWFLLGMLACTVFLGWALDRAVEEYARGYCCDEDAD